jgi:hypothetical protein
MTIKGQNILYSNIQSLYTNRVDGTNNKFYMSNYHNEVRGVILPTKIV